MWMNCMLNCTCWAFKPKPQNKVFHKDQMDGLHFSLSDRLRNCRGAATTPSQSVTATAFPCHRTARGLLLVFFANTTASTTPPFIPFSSVCSGQTKVAYLHFTFACSRAGVCHRNKNTSHMVAGTGWLEAVYKINRYYLFRLWLHENSLAAVVSVGKKRFIWAVSLSFICTEGRDSPMNTDCTLS